MLRKACGQKYWWQQKRENETRDFEGVVCMSKYTKLVDELLGKAQNNRDRS